MQPTAIILGAGVTGLSTAYHLALKKFGRIIVLDKGPVGDGSSRRAAAIITGLLWSETGVRARQTALRRYRELSHELEGYRFQDVGCLNLFDPASWLERERLLPLYDRLGAPYEILEADEMREAWPQLKPRDEFIGLFDPLGGYSEPDEYLPALAAGCRRLGVEIREHQAATGFRMEGGRLAAVRTATEEIGADAIISTLYSWTNIVLSDVGVRLPVKTVVHQRYVTRPLPEPLHVPAVNANPFGGYIRPAAGGRMLAGIETAGREEYRVTSREFHLSEVDAPPALRDQLRASFRSYVPLLDSVEWEEERVGLIGFAMDGEPVLGPVKAVPGLFVGLAFHSGGFAYNPVSGLLLAEFVADGKTHIDVTAFAPERFTAAETEEYLAMTVQQQDLVRRRH
ncbi:MAG: NAD(P)/FAD-dependent oxidoreductase [Bryobacteraceae bacterium]